MASTVPAAKAALLTLLQAHTFPVQNPVVRWGGPTESEDFPKRGELIYFGITEILDENQTLGATRYDETYNLQVVIEVSLPGDKEQAAEQRAWDLYAELQKVFDQNRTLSGSINRLTDRRVRQMNIGLPQEWLARIVVDQGCVGLVYNP